MPLSLIVDSSLVVDSDDAFSWTFLLFTEVYLFFWDFFWSILSSLQLEVCQSIVLQKSSLDSFRYRHSCNRSGHWFPSRLCNSANLDRDHMWCVIVAGLLKCCCFGSICRARSRVISKLHRIIVLCNTVVRFWSLSVHLVIYAAREKG